MVRSGLDGQADEKRTVCFPDRTPVPLEVKGQKNSVTARVCAESRKRKGHEHEHSTSYSRWRVGGSKCILFLARTICSKTTYTANLPAFYSNENVTRSFQDNFATVGGGASIGPVGFAGGRTFAVTPGGAQVPFRWSGITSGGGIGFPSIEAIRLNKFYILTHPEAKPGIQALMEDMLDERNPRFY